MNLPPSLDQWTYETVAHLVARHAFEPSSFEFKEKLTTPHGNGEILNEKIRQTACAMANSTGGFIIFGVMDAQRAQQQDIPITDRRRIVGIPNSSESLKHFGDKVSRIKPDLYFEAVPALIPIPNEPTRGIFAVHIPISPLRPHMADYVFPRRGDGGTNEKMNYFEVHNMMLLSQDRLRRANVLRLDLAQHREQIELMRDMEGESILSCLLRFDTSAIKPLLADACAIIPPDDEVIRQLIRLPPLANVANKFLDTGNAIPPRQQFIDMGEDPGVRTNHAESIRNVLDDLDDCCALCQQRLDRFLGPVGRPFGMTASAPAETGAPLPEL